MINRFFLVLFLTSAIILTGCKDNKARINGALYNHIPNEFIILEGMNSDELLPLDSVKVTNNGTFEFVLNPEKPSFYLLKLNNNNFLTMLIGPGEDVKINANRDSLNYPSLVEGSDGTRLMAEYNKQLRSTIEHLKSLNRIYEENENQVALPELMESLDSLAQGYLNKMNSYTKNYINENIKSLVSLVALYQQVAPGVPVMDQVKDWRYFVKVDSSLFPKYPDYGPVITLHRQVEELVATLDVSTSSGTAMEIAPDIMLPTPQGDTVSLHSTRGSVVLLDFWAAWCAPCRMENPNLVKAYDTYRRRGFQIFQVSLDKTREAWEKGIQDDKLERWIHVSDLQYWNSIVVPQYKIESIPANLLLDREGRIIARNLRGERLQQKLAEVFSK